MSRIKENTVSAETQLSKSDRVTFYGDGNIRIMFVGNSITKHDVLPEIGWNESYGMAASQKENDYVHLLMKKVDEKADAAYCICQVAQWERNYKNGEKELPEFEEARDFEADLIVMRAVENCPEDEFDGEEFKNEYKRLIQYLDKTGKAKVIITTSFWRHIADNAIVETALDMSYPYLYFGDMGERDEMMAIGLFEHKGVQIHPGDRGMEEIAERIWSVMKNYI